MLFVLFILCVQVAGVFAAIVLWPALPPNVYFEIAAVTAAYALTATLLVMAHWLLEKQDANLATSSLSDPTTARATGNDDRYPSAQRALFSAHEFRLRHLGLQHALLLSVPQGSGWTAAELTTTSRPVGGEGQPPIPSEGPNTRLRPVVHL